MTAPAIGRAAPDGTETTTVNIPHYSNAAAKLAVAALLAGCAILAPITSSDAAPLKSQPVAGTATPSHAPAVKALGTGSVKVAGKVVEASNEPQYASANLGQPPSLDAGNCQRPRKRLWVEGEGWIVRRVNICP